MSEPIDERYATFREHAETRERIASLEVTVSQLPTQLARIETAIIASRTNAPPADHVNWQSTAMRAMDMLERKASSGAHPVMLFLSGLGLLALGAGVAWVVLH